jgi:hypothetical protein
MGSSSAGVAQSQVKLQLKPHFPSKFLIQIEALVLPKLTSIRICIQSFMGQPDYVDDILKNNLRKISSETLCQETEFGWMLSGPITAKNTGKITTIISIITVKDLSNQLENFWEIENIDDAIKEDDEIENHYIKTVQRSSDVVKIPFKRDMKLGKSRGHALARFLNLEIFFLEMMVNFGKQQYTIFINE